MNYYIDTSSLIKIYHKEAGSQKVIEIYKSEEKLFISELAKIEFISTIHRKHRENEINIKTIEILTKKFQDDIELRYDVLKFSSMILDEAWRLVRNFGRQHPLKTLDSLQIAFFTTYCEKNDIFVCSDKRLKQIVQLNGHNVLIP
jgi:predicted nucleic acid-binding protein